MVSDRGTVGRVLWVVCLPDGGRARRMGTNLLISTTIETVEFVCDTRTGHFREIIDKVCGVIDRGLPFLTCLLALPCPPSLSRRSICR